MGGHGIFETKRDRLIFHGQSPKHVYTVIETWLLDITTEME